jgi:hypothetical protein
MWTILKFKKKEFNILKNNLKEKLGNNFLIYRPKLLIQNYKKNALVNKQIDIMGEYLFLFHKDLNDEKIIQDLNFTKGLKYILRNFSYSQTEIKFFLDKCKKSENENGLITQSLFDLNICKSYKFNTGPFTNEIFKIINLKKNKIITLLNNIKTTIDKRNFLFSPV